MIYDLLTDKNWYVPETHEYFIGGEKVPSVSQVLRDPGIDFVPKELLENAAKKGTAIHGLLAEYEKSPEATLLFCQTEWKFDYLHPWADRSNHLLLDYGESEYTLIEQPLFHERFGFGGTADLVRVNHSHKTMVIVDWKTGQHKTANLQTGAYLLLVIEHLKQLGIAAAEYDYYRFCAAFSKGTCKMIEYKGLDDCGEFLKRLKGYNV